MLQQKRITNAHISFSSDIYEIQCFNEEDKGCTAYHEHNELFGIFCISSDQTKLQLEKYIQVLRIDFQSTLAKTYDYFDGVFQLIIRHNEDQKIYSICDYLGVGGIYYASYQEKTHYFLNFSKFQDLQLPLDFDATSAFAHFAFGYQVAPFQTPYKNIHKFQGGFLYEHTQDGILTKEELDFPSKTASTQEIVTELKKTVNTSDKSLFFGMTAGKDSLALVSCLDDVSTTKSGNFGHENAADVLQGKALAEKLNLPYTHESVCTSEEFKHYAKSIAIYSGGLATASYVDMLKFVDKTIPNDYAFVMGEGGECVRTFFETANELEHALDNYLTPKIFLAETLIGNFKEVIDAYPKDIVNTIAENYQGITNAETLLQFYRHGRLPGNFGNRHKILSSYRDKRTPFLSKHFIAATHHLPAETFQNDALHRTIVETSNAALLPFFDEPLKTNHSVQYWEERIKDELGATMYQLLEANLDAVSEVFDKKNVLQLMQQQQKSPNRGLYFLFRILSMVIFVNSNRNSKS